jgi:OFA family oxalate/formate antiporter-like MFS transporter
MVDSKKPGARQLMAAGKPQSPFFYGWAIAIASALGIGFGVSVYLPATTGLLVGPLGRDLHWTPPQIYLALTFATTSTILIAPFLGSIVDRFSARRVIALSFLLEALLIASCHNLDGDIRWFYARYAAFALLATGTTAIGYSALLSRWFNRRRGLALGIALAGLGAGGVFWSLLGQWLLQHCGWRDAFLYMAGVVAVIILPIQILVLRDNPESMGLEVDGAMRTLGSAAAPPSASPGRLLAQLPDRDLTLRQVLGHGLYWLMMVTFFLVAAASYGVMLNVIPLLERQGATPQYAAAAQASIWSVLVFGRIITGWLMDRFFAPRVAQAFLVPPMVGVAMLAVGVSGPSAFVAAMLVGLAAGAEVDVLAYLVSRYFGLRHFGAIYSTYFAVYAVGTSAGPVFTAWMAARTGSYSAGLWCLLAALGSACAALAVYPRFRLIAAHASG